MRFLKGLIAISLFISFKLFAECSPYIGDATINEIYKEGGNNGDAFIEFKLLNSSISNEVYDNWTLKICHEISTGNNTTNVCDAIAVAEMNNATRWLWVDHSRVDREYLDFQYGFDLALLDENNHFIDYIQMKDYSGQNFTESCSYDDLDYVFPVPAPETSEATNGTKILLRSPDGIGEWFESKNLNEYVPSLGENNNGSASIDHFEINLIDGQGLTCEADNITIKACADASCTTLNTDATDVVLSVNNNTYQTVTVLEGSVNTSINYTTAGVATLSLDQTYECINGSPNNCDVTFADAGFRFLYGVEEAESTTIANQISGNNFADIVKLQAVKNVNGVCTGLFTGNVDVELSQQNIAPAGTTGLTFKINGNTGTSIAKYPTYTSNITLNFAADSKAIIPTPVYLDAGQISLHANYNVGGVSLMGSSNSFWVSPFKLIVTAKSDGVDINGSSSTSETIHKAGQPFDFTVMAINSLAPSTGNGTDNVTQNYQPNNNDIELLLTRTGPSTNGFDGSFNYGNGTVLSALVSANPSYQTVTLTDFNAGISTTNSASYSEVGLLKLDLRDVDYGFSGNTIEGDAIDIGRFTPDHFEQTVVEQGELDSVCNQSTTFAYIGQTLMSDESKGAISYLVNPVVELTAKNAQGNITKNYTESGYTKLEAAANFIKAPTVDSTIKAKDDSYLLLTASVEAGIVSRYGLVAGQPEFGISLDDGILHYELSDDDNFVYIRNENSEINAQDNDIDFVIDQINFVDTDGVAIVTPVDITGTIGIKLRFGRTYLENSFGPETSDLPIPMYTQYLANNNFVTNDLDSCTNYDMSKVTLTPSSVPAINTTVKVVPVSKLDNGATRDLILNAPGAGNQGTVNVEYDTSPWLKYDWDWDGVEAKALNQAPTAVATFGLFRGNDRIIYQREIHN